MRRFLKNYDQTPVQIRASFWFLVCAFLQKGIAAMTTPIFTRLMSTAEYGQFNIFLSWESILYVIISLNLYSGVYMQGMVKFDNERNEYASALQGLTLTLILAWTGIYFIFQSVFNSVTSLSTMQMVCMFFLMWTGSVYGFWADEQRIYYKYKGLVAVSLIAAIAKPLVGVLAVLTADDKVTARIIGLAIVELILFSGFFIVQMKRGKVFFSKKFWRYALIFNLPLIPHYLSMTVLNSVDRIMISQMVGESEAGIYSLAYSISIIMTIFNLAIIQTIEPWLFKKIKYKQIEDIAKVAYPVFSLIAGINLLLILVAPELVAVFAPKEYYDAVWIIPPVAMSVYFIFSYTFFSTFEFYYEKTKQIAIASLLGAGLNIVLNYFLIRAWGYLAAGYTTLVCYFLFAAAHYFFSRRICKKYLGNRQPYNTKTLLIITAVLIGCGLIGLYSYSFRWMRYSLIMILLATVFIKRKLLVKMIHDVLSVRKEKNAG